MNAKTESTSPPRRISVAWQPFSEKLAAVLANLAEDQYLIISVKRSNRVVQFAGQGASGIRAETVCNAYLPPSDQLDLEQLATLRKMGWQVPTGSPEEATPDNDPDGSPNFFVELPPPVSFAALADLSTRTLIKVLGVRHPGSLEYASFDSRGNTLVWPDLGLKRSNDAREAVDIPQTLLATLKAETSIQDLYLDADGDISIRYGSVLVWIRVLGEPQQVRMLAALLHDVEENSALLVRLNELNASVARTLFFVREDCVFAAVHVPAVPYIADHVVEALREFCKLTDGVDELLQSEFGGRTAFHEPMPSALKH